MVYLLASYFFLAIVLYVPGALLLRSLNFDRFLSVGLAPIVSCFAILTTGIVLHYCGIFANWGLVVLPFSVISVVAILVKLRASRKSGSESRYVRTCENAGPIGCELGINGGQLLLSLLVNAVIGGGIFLLAIDGPESFSQGFDTGHHLSQIMATVQYGNFSTLNVDLYGTGSGGFYPSMLHLIAALPVSLLGVSTSLALNAEILLLITLVYPVGIFLFGHQILKGHRYSGACSTILSLCFAGFPWVLLRYCPLLANFCTMALLPLALACFVYLLELKVNLFQRILLALLVLASVVVVAVAHPNGVFTAVLILFPYCLKRILVACNEFIPDSRKRNVIKVIGVIAFSLLTICVWLFLFNHPAFNAVVTYGYKAQCSSVAAVMGVLLQKMRNFAPNLPLAALVLVGVISAIREKGLRWLLFPYVLSAFMLIICGCLPPCQLKFLFCGFWYNHDYRIMAVFALCSLPLAALGLSQLIGILESRLSRSNAKRAMLAKEGIFQMTICSILVAAISLGLICFPKYVWLDGESNALPMAQALTKLRSVNDWNGEKTFYHSEERAFVRKATETIPEGSLVLNMPYDGSGYAYGLEGMNVYYRTNSIHGRMGDDETLVVQNLNNVASNPQVVDALKRMNVEYVLLLDQGFGDGSSTMTYQYSTDDWHGIANLDDECEGFDVLLSEGDMRLYKITCLDN